MQVSDITKWLLQEWNPDKAYFGSIQAVGHWTRFVELY